MEGSTPPHTCRLFQTIVWKLRGSRYDQHFVVQGDTHTIEADLQELTASSLFSWTNRHNRWAQMEARQLLKEMAAKMRAVFKPN